MCMIYSHRPFWTNRLLDFSHSANQSQILSFNVSLSLSLHPSQPPFPVTTKHLSKAFSALFSRTFIPLLYHSLIIKAGWGLGELCPQQKQWKTVWLTLYLWLLRLINSGEDAVWDVKHINKIWHNDLRCKKFLRQHEFSILLSREQEKSLWVIWPLTVDDQTTSKQA